jgi:hypothetical protein
MHTLPTSLVLFLAACTNPKGTTPGETAAADTSPVDSGLDTAASDTSPVDSGVDTAPSDTGTQACMPAHAWRTESPEVVSASLVGAYSFESWQLDVWLFANSLGWLTPTANGVRTWRVRYTTQDRGERVEATAIVAMPATSSATPRGTILWTHPTSGFEDACAPSIAAVEGLAPAIVQAARGYIVVAPDYLGLTGTGDAAPEPHPWIVAEPTAVASLDALRAVDAWLPTSTESARIDPAKIVYWGWSEGGFAALQADRYAPGYAPDYAPIGVVSAVPPLNLRGHVEMGVNTWSANTHTAALMLYLAGRWSGNDPSTALLSSVVAALPTEIAASCGTWPSVDAAGSADAVFQPDFLAQARAGDLPEPWDCVLGASSLPNPSVPYTGTAPILLVTAEDDTLVPTAPTRTAILALCDEGYTLEHLDCAGLEHGDAPVRTLQRQLAWIDARMRGEAVAAGCGVGVPVNCGG